MTATVMVSCRQRATTERPKTLKQLAAAGIHPTVVESPCNPAGPPLNRHAVYHALKGTPEYVTGVLFVEDDINVKPTAFPKFLNLAIQLNSVVDFVTLRESNYPDVKLLHEHQKRGWAPAVLVATTERSRRGWYGSQALYLPRWFVDQTLEDKHQFVNSDETVNPNVRHGFDFYVRDTTRSLYIAHPNPAQHRNPPKMKYVTARKPIPAAITGRHKSVSYDITAVFQNGTRE